MRISCHHKLLCGREGFFLAPRLKSRDSQRDTFFGGLSITEQRVGVRCQCQDTVPPAANLLAYSVHQMTVWVKPRCQALTVSRETNNNKRRNAHVTLPHISQSKRFRDESFSYDLHWPPSVTSIFNCSKLSKGNFNLISVGATVSF